MTIMFPVTFAGPYGWMFTRASGTSTVENIFLLYGAGTTAWVWLWSAGDITNSRLANSGLCADA